MSPNMEKGNILIGFFLLLPTTLEGVILLSRHVKEGQTITLDSGVRLDGTPRVDRLTWTFNGTAVAMMERVDGSDGTFWRVLVENRMKYALTKNGGLIIKNVDKNDEGEYVASSLNVNFLTHSVHLLEPEYKVDVSRIKFRCEEDGLKIKCHFNFPVYPGRKMLVKICRISTKQNQSERSKNCDYDAVDSKLFVNDEVEPGYQFSVEFNDTANHTIKAASKIFLQFSFLSDSHNLYNNNPQMMLLIVKTKAATTTQRPELKSDQQPTNDGTTEGPKEQDESTIVPVTQPQTSVSNTEEQVTTTTTHAATTTQRPQLKSAQQTTNDGTTEGPKNQDESTIVPVTQQQTSVSNTEEQVTTTTTHVIVIFSKDPLGTLKPTEDDNFDIISLPCLLTLCLGVVVGIVISCSWYHCCKRRERSGEYELSNNNDLELNQLTMSMA